ncbi:NAD-dependent epimerase/dehydratase family protein [Myxococcota bacterium]|nr:NAD-dependent epimerase/dehydratase family protein [Myxococcota bacterium]
MSAGGVQAGRVLLTGCCGYLGSWIGVALLRAGHTVRGTSMEPAYARDLYDQALAGLPDGDALRSRLEIVPAELLDAACWRGLAEGCEAVVHTASPLVTEVGVPEEAMLAPAVHGTEHVLREAARAGSVRRVLHMSSIVTLLDHHRPAPRAHGVERVGPADWNETASPATDPYAHAKVLGERLARRLVGERMPGADFASILPGPVIGPPVAGERLPGSVDKTLAPLLTGQLRFGSVDLALGVVDVRDVATAFVRALELPAGRLRRRGTGARYVVVGQPVTSMQALADAVRACAPEYGPILPRRRLPVPRPLLLAGMRLSLTPEAWSYTRAMLGRRVEYDTTLAEQDLGLRTRPLLDSVRDTVAWLRAQGRYPPPGG